MSESESESTVSSNVSEIDYSKTWLSRTEVGENCPYCNLILADAAAFIMHLTTAHKQKTFNYCGKCKEVITTGAPHKCRDE